MKEEKFTFNYIVYEVDELPYPWDILREKAIDAAANAYAPYSNFRVGAALMLSNGEFVSGSNQENVAYPSGLCAERVAMFTANHYYPESAPLAMALVAFEPSGEMAESISPCGACRQVLCEAERRFEAPMKLILCGKSKAIILPSAESSLPFSFIMRH
jgi:cytidine deaminase